MTGSDNRPNRLIKEKSPYLLQHAYNPVDWHGWNKEAFEKARTENKPVFLSIGYSTCHWCHVMEKKSFEDVEVAALMNEAFVSIKVDREERPDIDHVYMTVCQMMTGSGGWPLTIVMTPDKKPFFAKPASLRQLRVSPGGNFPFWEVYRKIDGQFEIRGHGTRDMPIWGDRFRAQAGGDGKSAQSQAAGRILSLVFYLQHIQE